jgi:hypothetical protein
MGMGGVIAVINGHGRGVLASAMPGLSSGNGMCEEDFIAA